MREPTREEVETAISSSETEEDMLAAVAALYGLPSAPPSGYGSWLLTGGKWEPYTKERTDTYTKAAAWSDVKASFPDSES